MTLLRAPSSAVSAVHAAAPAVAALLAAGLLTACGTDDQDSRNADAPDAGPRVDNPLLDEAVVGYRDYVDSQIDDMRTESDAFAAAVKNGGVDEAKRLYPISRRPWERIEPIAGLIPDFDGAVDSREDGFDGPTDEAFTGWHRIEYHLWVDGDLEAATPYAEQLTDDLADLAEAVPGLELTPGVLTVGAQELIEEVAAPDGKLSGEEDRYSGTDLYDFKANVEGSEALVDLLDPALVEADPELAERLDGQFAELDAQLAEFGSFEEGFANYDTVAESEREEFAATLGELAESLSQLNGTLGLA